MWVTYLLLPAAVLAGVVAGVRAGSVWRGLVVGVAVLFLPIALVLMVGFSLLKLGMGQGAS